MSELTDEMNAALANLEPKLSASGVTADEVTPQFHAAIDPEIAERKASIDRMTAGYCPVPRHPDDVTRAWLDRIGDPRQTSPEYSPPSQANEYFHHIGAGQRSIERNCG